MMNDSIAERLFENNVRIDWMIPLAGIQSPLAEMLHEFVEEADDREWELLRKHMPSAAKEFTKDDRDFGRYEIDDVFIGCAINDKLNGFLVRVSVPVPTERCGRGVMFSWGYTRFATLYGATIEAAFEAAIAWAIDRWAQDHAKLLPDRLTASETVQP